MVEDPLRTRIEEFIRDVGEDYEKVEGVTPEKLNEIQQNAYIRRIIGLPAQVKANILYVLEESWNRNQNHGHLRRWARATVGIAEYLLLPTEMSEVHIDKAADVVVRVSRWHHSNRSNLWIRFIPYACRVVELAWGDIEDLWNN